MHTHLSDWTYPTRNFSGIAVPLYWNNWVLNRVFLPGLHRDYYKDGTDSIWTSMDGQWILKKICSADCLLQTDNQYGYQERVCRNPFCPCKYDPKSLLWKYVHNVLPTVCQGNRTVFWSIPNKLPDSSHDSQTGYFVYPCLNSHIRYCYLLHWKILLFPSSVQIHPVFSRTDPMYSWILSNGVVSCLRTERCLPESNSTPNHTSQM